MLDTEGVADRSWLRPRAVGELTGSRLTADAKWALGAGEHLATSPAGTQSY
jgi:hypothetical protein